MREDRTDWSVVINNDTSSLYMALLTLCLEDGRNKGSGCRLSDWERRKGNMKNGEVVSVTDVRRRVGNARI